MERRQKFTSIDEYLAAVPPKARRILQKIRREIRAEVPEAEETFSYQMPAFRRGRIFIYFAAFKQHIGIYPPVKGDKALQKALLPYRGEKGNLKFPLEDEIPYDLIRRVAAALAREYAKR